MIKKKPAGHRPRRSRSERQALLRKLHSSDLTQLAFAEREGIPLSTLTYWLRCAREEEQRNQQLIPVDVVGLDVAEETDALSAGHEIVIELRAGHRVRVPAGVDHAVLRDVLTAVSSC